MQYQIITMYQIGENRVCPKLPGQAKILKPQIPWEPNFLLLSPSHSYFHSLTFLASASPTSRLLVIIGCATSGRNLGHKSVEFRVVAPKSLNNLTETGLSPPK